MTGVSTGVRPEDRRKPLVGASTEGGPAPLRGPSPAGRSIDSDTSREYRSDMTGVPRCYRHQWQVTATVTVCVRCGAVRDEARKRLNRNNRARGANFERTVAKALGGRRTGPLGGRDDVVGENFAAQTKKTINFSGRQARVYLDDLSRTYPTRTALVIHAEPGKDREAIVVLRLVDWVQWHGPDAVSTEGENVA